jgi:hypothetical protein
LITKIINCLLYSIYIHCLFELWCAHLINWDEHFIHILCSMMWYTQLFSWELCFVCVTVVYCIFVTCIACIVFLWFVLLILCFAVMFWLVPYPKAGLSDLDFWMWNKWMNQNHVNLYWEGLHFGSERWEISWNSYFSVLVFLLSVLFVTPTCHNNDCTHTGS